MYNSSIGSRKYENINISVLVPMHIIINSEY